MTDFPPADPAASDAVLRDASHDFSQRNDALGNDLSDNLSGERCYQRRLKRVVKIFRVIFGLAGFVLLVVQIVQGVMSVSDGGGISRNIIIGCCVAVGLMLIARPPALEWAIARFSHRYRYKSFQLYTFIVPFFMAAVVLWAKVKIGPTSDEWRYVSSEGSLSEYGTAIVYLLIPAFTYPMMRQFRREKRKFLSIFYGLFTFGAFFVGMEEISWGQRLLGFEEPEFLSKHNVQSEFTLHNLSFFQEHFLHDSFLLAGFIGSSCWLGLRYWQKRLKKKSSALENNPRIDPIYILPDWFLSSYFFPIFVFYVAHDYTDLKQRFDFLHHADQEHWEFVMSIGLLLFVMINFFRQAKAIDAKAVNGDVYQSPKALS